MASAVSGFLTWCAEYLPVFFMSHPVLDVIAIAVGIWVLALVGRILLLRF